MQKINLLFAFILIVSFQYLIGNLQAQTSIHQQQLTYYNSLGNADANYYEQNTTAAKMQHKNQKLNCTLNKVVYGWHPFWVGNAYQNYDWDLLSHFSFFSYEVDAATGNPNSTHGWATSAAVDAALASGNTKVTLTATLFSGHATFFNSSTAQQTLITNLINLIQSRGAHGVNIDIEGLPSAYKTAFTNFMINLANQMHAAIPNSDVSTVLYAVDWNNVFDFTNMAGVVDHFIIMGYDYYWTGSTTAGPNDPLYHFSTTYNYNLSRSITYYLNKGCPKNKLILGLPYYGREWPTTSTTVPSQTTGNGIARFYNDVKTNASGNFSTANHQYDNDSYSDIYVFNNGGPRQCFISLENSLRKRMEHINTTGIGGMGMWALGYDDGYTDLWDAIEDYMTTCFSYPCSGTIHDFGGPYKNYYDNENYTWTIAPTGAGSINVNFTSFDVETGFDYLYIYDGATTAAPQIAGSPFTGTTLPPSFTSSTGALTFRFTSDGATVRPGFVANYSCNVDNIAPTTSVSAPTGWVTSNFTANFTDADNTGGSGIQKS
ncbi:MAG: glycosyl hydrolase family 18 protein, partial [Flavobacteriales bacterium]|nr:glycosyl hydrolase family 18 protein [Flavobacteriales bacterium]MCW8912140.1 glycosyl hydrolase family 18 protein [Flavobacteriales bacterium]MCW8938935.1 glycosyl hydrolase family 18 protein [Flavobacteriales bacterium]MCW8941434.1 glycosyl hydrolase family 18 protein [Flavobacteriales bacterium]MCW8969069.1 glycosyl hydrolase family 18 protein [Flavobacteriales bacterium]